MLTSDAWLRDMPQQFQGKRNIGVLVGAFARQLDELARAFADMDAETDLETAHGSVLDMVGSIVCMTRAEAAEMDRRAGRDGEMADERYRQYLRWKKLANTSWCTYSEIMDSIEALWDAPHIEYAELPERPATIFIRLSGWDVDCDDPTAGRGQAIKAAGVGFVYAVGYSVEMDWSWLERAASTLVKVHAFLPFYGWRHLDGSEALDGGGLLDSFSRAVLRMSAAVAARVRHGGLLGLGLGSGLGPFRVAGMESATASIAAGAWMRFWGHPLLDGGGLLDGSELLDDRRGRLGAGAKVRASVRTECGAGCGPVAFSHNAAWLDGRDLLDGRRDLDSTYREEEL